MAEKLVPILTIVFMLLSVGVLFAADRPEDDPEVIASLDLQRYAGTWYEIARFPNRFQKACAGDVTATYSLLEAGKMKVVNRCSEADGTIREAEGLARLATRGENTGKLEVRFAPAFLSFLPFVWADYWILELAEDYSYAAVGTPNREYLWILARTPVMAEEDYRSVIEGLGKKGFQTDALVRTRQKTPD